MVITDTSPLNYLILIGADEILPQLYGEVLAATAVISELPSSGYSACGHSVDINSFPMAQGSQGSRNFRLLSSDAVGVRLAIGCIPGKQKERSRSKWIAEKQKKLGTAKACAAVANKNARIIWALLAHDEPYRRAA